MPHAACCLLIAGLGALLLAGCGEHKTPLGTLSDHDLHALSAMQRYLGKMRGVTTAADRLIGYYEHTSSPKAATVNRLVAKFRQTALAAHRADETLIGNILKHSTPAQRKQLRTALQRANQQYNRVVGG